MTLHMTVGLPRSGKSTWAKAQGWPVVSPDAIRVALHGRRYVARAEQHVWAIARTMVAALFEAGHEDVVLDACSTTRARRDEWLGLDEEYKRRFVLFQRPAADCIGSAEEMGDADIIPVIQRMAAAYEPPTVAELKSGEPSPRPPADRE